MLLALLLSIIFIVGAIAWLKLHPFLSLLVGAIGYGLLCGTMAAEQIPLSLAAGFGATMGHIGIVILAGSVIGTFLERSGGARQIAESLLRLVGERRVPLAMGSLGYIVSIPVFCDSGFVILAPLAKAMARRAGSGLAVAVTALSLGLILTHSLVPPTPGPVGAAALVEADLGLVILFAIPISLVGLCSAWLFAVTAGRKVRLLSTGPPVTGQDPAEPALPSIWRSLAPILLPIVLILLKSLKDLHWLPALGDTAAGFIAFAGQPPIALLIGVGAAILLPGSIVRERLSAGGWIGESVVTAAGILVVTGCGGAFGRMLQDSGIAEAAQGRLSIVQDFGLLFPILVAAVLKLAQGSGTVAIITTAGIVAPILGPLGLEAPLERALVVVAIGAGSLVASHVNDSYFWVVTQISGMTVPQGYRLQTLGTATLGFACSAAVLVTGWWVS
jgi:gluconate:H+ symporter, GntP family